jgi:crossover junction endodeoxyribonuclease RuvC
MKILGIDPGYDRLGVAVVEKNGQKYEYLFSDCIVTDRDLPFSKRLLQIYKSLGEIIKEHRPIKVAQARGVCLALCEAMGLEVTELTPLQIKGAMTGYGKASKDQIHFMVHKIVKIPEMTAADKVAKKKILDDEIDAIAIAISTGAYLKKY